MLESLEMTFARLEKGANLCVVNELWGELWYNVYCIELRSFYGASFYKDAWRCE